MLRPGLVLLSAALLLTACGSDAPATTGVSSQGAPASATAEGPGPSDKPDPGLSGSPTPTRPPGDPGPGDPTPAESHDEEPVDEVPDVALVDAETLGALAGGSWSAVATPSDCTGTSPSGPAEATASRTAALASDGGRLVESIASFGSVRAASAAVTAAADSLTDCGFSVTGDPRLGDASRELTRAASGSAEAERAVVLAAEGVAVVLVASGSAAAPGAWESLADIALGSSCAAAPHGCH